jgi:SAM-dependent methyltransferase
MFGDVLTRGTLCHPISRLGGTKEKPMSTQALREFIDRHNVGATALAALAAALDARATGTPLDPKLAPRVQELLAVVGGGDALEGVSAQEAAPFLHELRAMMLIDSKLLYPHTRIVGWRHTDGDLLQPVGDFSRGFAQALTRMVVPALAGLGERFRAPDAAFLDVGVGVGSLSIAMAQMWPELRVVGIDPWAPSIKLARDNVDRAGLKARIELRELGVERLEDRDAFDLAWLPLPFLPEPIAGEALRRTLGALRPGGWVVATPGNFAAMKPEAAAMQRLRLSTFGGAQWEPDEVRARLREAGFVEVGVLPTPPSMPIVIVVARRAV